MRTLCLGCLCARELATSDWLLPWKISLLFLSGLAVCRSQSLRKGIPLLTCKKCCFWCKRLGWSTSRWPVTHTCYVTSAWRGRSTGRSCTATDKCDLCKDLDKSVWRRITDTRRRSYNWMLQQNLKYGEITSTPVTNPSDSGYQGGLPFSKPEAPASRPNPVIIAAPSSCPAHRMTLNIWTSPLLNSLIRRVCQLWMIRTWTTKRAVRFWKSP